VGREARLNAGSWADRTVYFGTPHGFTVDGPHAASRERLLAYELSKGRNGNLWELHYRSGLYIAENRHEMAEAMLATPANWLLMVDSDVAFPRTLIESMLATAGADKRILAASVPLGETYPTCAFNWVGPAEPGVYRSVPVGLEPRRVDAFATACCLVHRDVFEAIAAREGRKWFAMDIAFPAPGMTPETPLREFRYTFVGEDIAFSLRAKSAGFDIWCYHLPGLAHWKRKSYSHDEERSQFLAVEATDGTGELIQEDDREPA
jgi:hypothetical protein